MKKINHKRIIALIAVFAVAVTSGLCIGGKSSIRAEESEVAGTTYYNVDQLDTYNNGLTDWVNGEKVLRAEDKANVLVNIMEKEQKLTILEIVPYELASVFDILVPNQEQSDLIASYGDEIFNVFPEFEAAGTRVLDSQNGSANNITDDGQPITVYSEKVAGVSDSSKLERAKTIAQAIVDSVMYTNDTTADDVINAVNDAIEGCDAVAEWDSTQMFSKVDAQSATDGMVTGRLIIKVGELDSVVTISRPVVAEYGVEQIQEHIKNCIIRDISAKVTESTTETEVKEIVLTSAQNAYDELAVDSSEYRLNIFDWYGPTYSKTDATATSDGKITIGFRFDIVTKEDYNGWIGDKYNSVDWFYTDVTIDKPAYNYTAEIKSYYLDRLLEGYEDTPIYKYYDSGNVEVKTVVAGQLTYDDIYNEDDPVDIIYVAGYATDLSGHIYRNAFFQQPIEDAETAVDFMKNGDDAAADALFSTNVYHKVDGEYVEYTFSELISEKVWYDSYSKVGDEYIPNELNWNSVKLIMEYVFGGYNTNYRHIYYDDDETEHVEQQRVSCMYQISAFANNGEATADNNMAKLYYLLCKTTDQPDTATLDKDIKTYYRDPDYFYKKYFTETQVDGTPYTYDNGVTTAAYNGDVDWKIYFSAQQDVKWFMFEVNNDTKTGSLVNSLYSKFTEGEKATFESQLAERGKLWILNQTKDYYLFLTSWCNDGRYIPYNGVVGLLNNNGVNLLKPYTDKNWSDSGARLPGVENRFDGNNYTTISINNYFLGIDETDFLTRPDAMFTNVVFTKNSVSDSVDAEMAANKNAFVVYMYESNVDYDGIAVHYKVTDKNAKLVSGALMANYKVKDESGKYVSKSAVVKEYTEAELAGLNEFTDYYEIKDNAEIYQAFKDKNLTFTFTVKSEVEGKKKVYSLTDTANLYFVYRQLMNLD